MKPTFGILTICLLAFFANVKSENESIFEQNFKLLHREPYLPPEEKRAAIETLWIDQKLDNFDANNDKTWKMRVLANAEFFQEGGPVFIFVGGEWEISKAFIAQGHFYNMAKEHRGYLFSTEHRYYGQSYPTSDISTKNLRYLNVRQALADLANFIRTVKATMPGMANSKFIISGCSYSGTMVTWFKELYPDLAVGVWASSAPVFAKVDFLEYRKVVGESLAKLGGEDCYNRIKNGISEMQTVFAKKHGNEIKKMLNVCNGFDENNHLDVWTMFYEIAEVFATLVQSDRGGDTDKACKKIMEGGNDLTGLITYLHEKFGTNCKELSYKGTLTKMMNVTNTNSASRQWMYQTCNEFGWLQTTNAKDQPFGTEVPLKLFTTMCRDLFGKHFTYDHIKKQVWKTNKRFGGYQPNVQNVYFTQGALDPWLPMGIHDDRATIIPMTAHCMDFSAIRDKDNPGMRASKERIAELVREWLGTNK